MPLLKGLPRPVCENNTCVIDADKHCKGFKPGINSALIRPNLWATSLREGKQAFNSQKPAPYPLVTRNYPAFKPGQPIHKRQLDLFERVRSYPPRWAPPSGRRGDLLTLAGVHAHSAEGLGTTTGSKVNHSHRTRRLKVQCTDDHRTAGRQSKASSTRANVNVTIEIGGQSPLQGVSIVLTKAMRLQTGVSIHFRACSVTRLKSNRRYNLEETEPCHPQQPAILAHHALSLQTSPSGRAKRTKRVATHPVRKERWSEKTAGPRGATTTTLETPAHIHADATKRAGRN